MDLPADDCFCIIIISRVIEASHRFFQGYADGYLVSACNPAVVSFFSALFRLM